VSIVKWSRSDALTVDVDSELTSPLSVDALIQVMQVTVEVGLVEQQPTQAHRLALR